jgi:hypothetical protein
VEVNDSLLHKNKFYLHIFSLANNKFKPTYEVIFKQGTRALAITPIFTQKSTEKEGAGLELQYRGYYRVQDTFTKFKKLYMAPYSFYEYIENSPENSYYNSNQMFVTSSDKTDFISKYGVGLVFGTQVYLLDNRLVLDGYLGGGIQRADVNNNSGYDYSQNIYEEGFSGVTVRGGFQVGFVF